MTPPLDAGEAARQQASLDELQGRHTVFVHSAQFATIPIPAAELAQVRAAASDVTSLTASLRVQLDDSKASLQKAINQIVELSQRPTQSKLDAVQDQVSSEATVALSTLECALCVCVCVNRTSCVCSWTLVASDWSRRRKRTPLISPTAAPRLSLNGVFHVHIFHLHPLCTSDAYVALIMQRCGRSRTGERACRRENRTPVNQAE